MGIDRIAKKVEKTKLKKFKNKKASELSDADVRELTMLCAVKLRLIKENDL